MLDWTIAGIVGPAQDLDGVGGERTTELERVAARHDELSEFDDDGDALCLGRAAGERLQVQRPQQITIDQFQRRTWLPHQRLRRRLSS